jgi:TP901 family phage tail tape measure protein
VADDLSETGAVEVLARTGNLFGLGTDQAERLAGAYAGLSSSTLGTASALAKTTSAFGGVAAKMGLTAGQALGIAGALANVGESGKVGGRQVQAVLVAMTTKQKEFARLLGMTTGEYQRLFREDPAGAFNQVLVALSKLDVPSGKFANALQRLGLGSRKTTGTLANLTKVLGESGTGLLDLMNKGNDLFNEGTELNRQFELKTRSFNAALDTLKGSLKNVGIAIGDTLLPILTSIVNFLVKVVAQILKLPKPLFKVMAMITALGGVALIAVGTIIKLAGMFVLLKTLWVSVVVPFLLPPITAFLVILGKVLLVLGAVFLVFKVFQPVLNRIYIFMTELFKELMPVMGELGAAFYEVGVELKNLFFEILDLGMMVVRALLGIPQEMNPTKKELDDIKEAVRLVADGIRWMTRNVIIPMVHFIRDFVTGVRFAIGILENLLTGNLYEAFLKVKDLIFGSSFLHITEGIYSILPSVQGFIESIRGVLEPLATVSNNFKTFFEFLYKGFQKGLDMVNKMGTVLGNLARLAPGGNLLMGKLIGSSEEPGLARRALTFLTRSAPEKDVSVAPKSSPGTTETKSAVVGATTQQARIMLAVKVMLDGHEIARALKDISIEEATRDFDESFLAMRGVS